MGSRTKIALLVAGSFSLMMVSSPGVAAEGNVPKLNIKTSCESTARRLIFTNSSKESCIQHEMQAHQVLTKHWHQYAKTDKTNCVGKVTQGGPPSYSELESCLDTLKHAREVRKSL